ncbi:MAG: hypothetical protein NC400_11630 [Clostridium sp.]|nr:hypothetical protein [Clostridium sp.]
MSTQENSPSPEEAARGIGILANVIFLIFLLFPFLSLNGVTMRSNYRYIIWAMAIVALILRVKEKEKAAMIFSVLSTLSWIIIYAMSWQSGKLTALTFGLEMKTHPITALLMLLLSILMIRPSLISASSEK